MVVRYYVADYRDSRTYWVPEDQKDFELHPPWHRLLQTQKPMSFLLTHAPASSLNLIPPNFFCLSPSGSGRVPASRWDNTELTHSSWLLQKRETRGHQRGNQVDRTFNLFSKQRKVWGSYKEEFVSNSSLLVHPGSQKAIFKNEWGMWANPR